MTGPLILIGAGIAAVVACHGWWRNPTDHLTNALSTCWTALTSLYAKGPRA